MFIATFTSKNFSDSQPREGEFKTTQRLDTDDYDTAVRWADQLAERENLAVKSVTEVQSDEQG